MSKYRNCFNRLEYTITTAAGVFSVTKNDNRIIKHETYYNTDAYLNTGLVIGDNIPRFDSFIKAVAFMKKHAADLI